MNRKVWTTPYFDSYEVLRGHCVRKSIIELTEFYEPEYDKTLQENRQRPSNILDRGGLLPDDGGGIC